MQRAECLYRVSTKGQVDHDDIPMQRIECRKFAEEQGWTIIKELCEKGVSGFKVAAEDRDAIQELRNDAMNKRFDILLVFMFDRLGRRDDETPFVVEWFARQGIRIFSVKEGEQKFESHTDSLINYIRYWQSEGESRKTSMRIKTRLDQMRAEGLYTGGPVRFGYQAIEKGRLNKKNKPVKDLVINPEEAAVIKEVFERTVYEGAGSFVLAKELNERGVRTHSGAKLTALSINRMLKERQYTGYLITKDVTSPYMPELQIIDQELFDQAQEIVTQRKTKNAEWRNIPRQNGNGTLLGGNLYCATCGRRMTSSNPGQGAKRDKAEYICYMGANHRNGCKGQRAYVAKRVEDIVLQATRLLLDTIKEAPRDESVEARVQAEVKDLTSSLRKAKQRLEETAQEQEGLEMEVARCLLGKSNFTTAMLSKLIDDKLKEKHELENQVLDLERRLANQKEMSEKVSEYYNRFLGWSMEFGLASIERKRIIISQLYKRIELGRGYVINFEVDWNYEQFIDTLMVQQHKGLTAVGVPLPPKIRKGGKKAAKQKQGVA